MVLVSEDYLTFESEASNYEFVFMRSGGYFYSSRDIGGGEGIAHRYPRSWIKYAVYWDHVGSRYKKTIYGKVQILTERLMVLFGRQ